MRQGGTVSRQEDVESAQKDYADKCYYGAEDCRNKIRSEHLANVQFQSAL